MKYDPVSSRDRPDLCAGQAMNLKQLPLGAEHGCLFGGERSAELALAFALEDHGLTGVDAAFAVVCDPEPCLERGGLVNVTVAAEVPLPLVPPFVQSALPVTVPLEAVASQRVSRFAGAG